MFKPWLAGALAACTWACGGSKTDRTSPIDAGSAEDAAIVDAQRELDGARDGALDASNTVRCGDTSCGADEVCVYPACGCRALSALPDGGCPPRFSPSQSGLCAANCPFYPPYCWSPDGGLLLCSGQDGTIADFINEPVPAGSSHVCHELCI
jgi:hypothetical protein